MIDKSYTGGPASVKRQALTGTLSSAIYERLRAGILNGEFPPETWLREEQLAADFQVSRTPVREAIRRLEAEGLVRVFPRRGALLTGLALEELDEVYDLRAALETLAASRAIGRISEDELQRARAALDEARAALARGDLEALIAASDAFHAVVYRASHSVRLWTMIAGLSDVIRRYRTASLSVAHRAVSVIEEHAQLLEAIQRGDRDAVVRLMAAHVEHARAAAIRAELDRARSRRARATT